MRTVALFLRIRQFELMLREFFVEAIRSKFGDEWPQKLEGFLGSEATSIRDKAASVRKRFGITAPPIPAADLIHYCGYEHYILLVENGTCWERCIRESLPDRSQLMEGLKMIRDARNEIMHMRSSIHPKLWSASQLYIDILSGRLQAPRYAKLVERVQESTAKAI